MKAEATIETGVHATLCYLCRLVAEGAGLAVLKGDVGIGKTFALAKVVAELETDGFTVVMVTATEATSGNVNAFLRMVLGRYHTETGSSADAEEALWQVLAGHPFATGGRRVVFIIDEAQKLSGRVLETIRGLWDRGDNARLGNKGAPAFGCVMVGNPTFMGKGGAQRTASFEPLLSRLTVHLRLPGPSRQECQSFASSIYADATLAAELAVLGETRGNLRVMASAARVAAQCAGDNPVSLADLRKAIKLQGLK